MLIHIDNALDPGEKQEAVSKIAVILPSLTRETDIKGWYKQGSIMGIVLTETDGTGAVILLDNIRGELLAQMHIDIVRRIEISLHAFPGEQGTDPTDGPVDMTLYSDLSQKIAARRISLIMKRVIDVFGSLTGIILFSLFFLIVPIWIRITTKGPALFRQKRVGQFGKVFTMLKFRTMKVDCDPQIHKEYIRKLIQEKSCYSGDNGNGANNGNGNGDLKPVYKICDDPRITPIGRYLRKTSLDELPQFLNVLWGEMSLVGPRPPIPYELENYDPWHWRRIFEVKPGITGLWQVKGRSSTNFDEMVRLDLQYSREWSIWLDLKIIFTTPIVLFSGKGGY